MRKHLPTITQALGTTILSMSIASVSKPFGFGFAGVAMIVFGIAAERTPPNAK